MGGGLFDRASGIDDRRVKAAYGKAKKALAALKVLVDDWERQSSARAEIQQLEQRLAEAKAALRGNRPATLREGGYPCPNAGCGKVSANPQGAAAHSRFCAKKPAVAWPRHQLPSTPPRREHRPGRSGSHR